MWVGVLGPTLLAADPASPPVDLRGLKPRALLADLALHDGRAVSADHLALAVWGDNPPAGVGGTLQAYIAGLRKALEPDRAPRERPTVLVTDGVGYALRLGPAAVDARQFETVITDAQRTLAPITNAVVPTVGALPVGHVEEVVAGLDEALGWWRGEPYEDIGDESDEVVAERQRLNEQRLIAVEHRLVARLALGGHAAAAAELEALTVRYPLRERLWTMRALALARSGRQADALSALQSLRDVLDEELGLEPSAAVRDLQTAILRQAPELEYAAPSDQTAPRVPLPRASGSAVPAMPDWPMVGRDDALDQLLSRLALADGGAPQFASLIGEPGIGKTRLASELGARAAESGATLLIGRCSQDEGAPALWPWVSVLGGLGLTLPETAGGSTAGDKDAEQFLAWDTICRAVLDASDDQLVVLGIDDLHWADQSTLRVLRHLCDIADRGRLLVLTTWRPNPEPVGALAELAETFARHDALSLSLAGLSEAETHEVLSSMSDVTVADLDVSLVCTRSEGNPFFLIEYAKMLTEAGPDLESPDLLPRAVADVVTRRVLQLPDETQAALRVAAVVGRSFDLPLLASSMGLDELAALDHLEPALASGLVRDESADQLRFSHALVRDGVYAGLSPTRRGRTHGAVARALEQDARFAARTGELALHWGESGPGNAGRAWRAAVRAADDASRVHAYQEAASWLETALVAMDSDPESDPRERYDAMIALAEAHRWSGNLVDMSNVITAAATLGEQLGDPELVVRAATLHTTGALWQPQNYGHVDEERVAQLRRALRDVAGEDSAAHCRLLLCLAAETYYGSTAAERDALTEQAEMIARRLSDPALLIEVYLNTYIATWRPSTANYRRDLAAKALALAIEHGDVHAEVLSRTLLAAVCGELGLVDEMWAEIEIARPLSFHHRMLYASLVIDSMQVPWLALGDRFDEADKAVVDMLDVADRLSLPQKHDGVRGAMLILALWRGFSQESEAILGSLQAESTMPITPAAIVLLLRNGKSEDAEQIAATFVPDDDLDDWFAVLYWCCVAELACGLARPELGAWAYRRLAPFRGRTASSGSGGFLGPVDAFLALAAASTGELEQATRHADDAMALCEKWKAPLAARWLRDQRERHGF